MFTNEFDFESTITTVLDEEGNYEDLILDITDEVVYIRQYNDATFEDVPDLISISPKMFKDMIQAMNYSEGLFITKYKLP